MWAYWHWNKNIRGRYQGSRWLRGLIMGYVLPLIFWLPFSPGGKWLKMATLLWPLGWVVSSQVLINKDQPPSNKRSKRETWSKGLTDLPRSQWAIKNEKIIIIIKPREKRKKQWEIKPPHLNRLLETGTKVVLVVNPLEFEGGLL
jgi:hypothetical protein